MRYSGRAVRIRRYSGLFIVMALIATLTWLCLYRYSQVSLVVEPQFDKLSTDVGQAKELAWPSYGQSAVAAEGYGVLETFGSTKPQSTASTAKIIAMLAVLQEKPITDDHGATITFSQADVDLYNTYRSSGGSIVAVSSGLSWTQYQATQAVLLASANNVSDSLAIWAFGSLDKYQAYAQKMVKEFGMDDTTIGADASGYSTTTVSTAHDLALLALKALEQPVVRDIIAQESVILPGAGTIKNTNTLLATDGTVGVKTGYAPETGGVFILAGQHSDNGHTQSIVTVVMGAPFGSSSVAQTDAYDLYKSALTNMDYRQIIAKGQRVGSYSPVWMDYSVDIVADDDINMFTWGDRIPEVNAVIHDTQLGGTSIAGDIEVGFGSWSKKVTLSVDQPIAEPSLWWRIVERPW